MSSAPINKHNGKRLFLTNLYSFFLSANNYDQTKKQLISYLSAEALILTMISYQVISDCSATGSLETTGRIIFGFLFFIETLLCLIYCRVGYNVRVPEKE